MSEQFDKKISEKYRTSFKNYNEEFNEEAWILMKQKLKNKNKKFLPLWIINTGKAASVILILGISILLPKKIQNRLSENKNIEYENIISNNPKHQSNDKLSSLTGNKTTSVTDTLKSEKLNKKYANRIQKKDTIKLKNNIHENLSIADTSKIQTHILNEHIFITEQNTQKDTVLIAKNIKKDTSNNKPRLLPEDNFLYESKKTKKKFKFGIALSSYYTSSDIGATDNINIGGGFSTDYLLSDNISLNSGLLIANHNLNTEHTELFNKFTKSDALNESNVSYSGVPETKISIIGLDIPLNIKYNINKFAVSAGISSLFYLKETYTSNYYIENSTNVYNSQTGNYDLVYTYDNISESNNTGAFKTFDFAKLVNISATYKVKLKKGNLIFGPYAKIPTGSLTAYNITFGYGGFNIQYEF